MPDAKITELTELTSVEAGDLLAIVDDPGGSPLTKKITRANLVAGIGGGAIGSDTLANRPAAGNAGNLFLPTDAVYVYRDSGSVWVPWGPIYPMKEPVSGDYAWVNQGSASVSTVGGGVYLESPTNSSAHSLRIRKKAAPGTPWTIRAAFSLFADSGAAFLDAGLVLRESSTGKLTTFEMSATALGVNAWTNETTYSSTPASVTTSDWFQRSRFWLEITDNATNLIYKYSMDGFHYIQLLSESRTARMSGGPNEVGFFVNPYNQLLGLWVLSWLEE